MSHDTWVHRGVRRAVRPLVATPVTPNHLTTLRLVAGLAAAAAFAHGAESWRLWGAGIFVFATLLDRADGELARLSGRTSPRGHAYDLVSDALGNALAFVGLGIGLREGAFGPWAVPIGLVAGLAIGAVLWLIIKLEAQHGERAGELRPAKGFDPDDALFVVPVLVWLGLADWLLLAAGLGAPAFAGFMFLRFRARLRGAASL